MLLKFKEIIDIYEGSKPWYGAPIFNENYKFIDSFVDALQNIDLVLLDSYGVLCKGSETITSALQAIDYLRAHNIAFCVVSNDTMNGRYTVEEKYKKIGFDFKQSEILTSLDVTECYLNGLENDVDLSNYAVIGLSDNLIFEKFPQMQNLNETNGKLRENITNLIFHIGKGWNMEMQNNLIKTSININNVIISNPDVGAPEADMFVATPGFYALDFYKKTKINNKPLLLGKPSKIMFKHALDKLNYKGKPENVLMVGDTLHTDILGANLMGFKSLLVKSGIFNGQDIDKYIKQTKISPTYIANSL